jgi:hypothetical protein
MPGTTRGAVVAGASRGAVVGRPAWEDGAAPLTGATDGDRQ